MQEKRLKDKRLTAIDFSNKEEIATLSSASLKIDYILTTETQYSAL